MRIIDREFALLLMIWPWTRARPAPGKWLLTSAEFGLALTALFTILMTLLV